MKRPRITIGRLMIAVGLIGIVTWCGIGLHRWQSRLPMYRAYARNHAEMLRAHVIAVREPSHSASPTELAELNRQWYAYHTSMKEKWERAAAYPWSRAESDPPDPVPLSDPRSGRSVDLHYDR